MSGDSLGCGIDVGDEGWERTYGILDFKKEYREFYMPQNKPEIVTVQKANYIAVQGNNDTIEAVVNETRWIIIVVIMLLITEL